VVEMADIGGSMVCSVVEGVVGRHSEEGVVDIVVERVVVGVEMIEVNICPV